MKVRFQADADLNQTILLATIRREPAIDFQTATMAGLLSVLDDMQVLERTAREGQVLATHDRKTMPRIFPNLSPRNPVLAAQQRLKG